MTKHLGKSFLITLSNSKIACVNVFCLLAKGICGADYDGNRGIESIWLRELKYEYPQVAIGGEELGINELSELKREVEYQAERTNWSEEL